MLNGFLFFPSSLPSTARIRSAGGVHRGRSSSWTLKSVHMKEFGPVELVFETPSRTLRRNSCKGSLKTACEYRLPATVCGRAVTYPESKSLFLVRYYKWYLNTITRGRVECSVTRAVDTNFSGVGRPGPSVRPSEWTVVHDDPGSGSTPNRLTPALTPPWVRMGLGGVHTQGGGTLRG